MIATAFGVLAWIFAISSILGIAWSVWPVWSGGRKPMVIALGYAELSLIFSTCQGISLHNYVSVALGAAGMAVTGAVMWRCWPAGWFPWKTVRNAIEQGRLARLSWRAAWMVPGRTLAVPRLRSRHQPAGGALFWILYCGIQGSLIPYSYGNTPAPGPALPVPSRWRDHVRAADLAA